MKISLLHIACRLRSAPLPCLEVFHPHVPFPASSLHLGTAPILGPSFPQQPVFASAPSSVHISPYFDASPQCPLRVLSLSSRDIPGSAPTTASLLSKLPPPQRPSFSPARTPQRLLLRQLLAPVPFGTRPLARSPAPRPQPRPSLAAPPRARSGQPLGPRPSPSPRPPQARFRVPDEFTSCACPNSRK